VRGLEGCWRGAGGKEIRRRRWCAIVKAWQGDAVDTLRIWEATASLPHFSASLYVMLRVRWFGGRAVRRSCCSRVGRKPA
jgi:hypothetical protein